MADILVVDDDETMATAFRQFLAFEGHDCRIASDAAEAGRMIAATRPDLVLMDIRMPGTNGLDALEQFRADFPGLCIVMMTAYSTSANSTSATPDCLFFVFMSLYCTRVGTRGPLVPPASPPTEHGLVRLEALPTYSR